MRMLQHGGQPTQLGEALAHFGRIFKTLHVLAYVDAEPYRREIKGMRNLQEGRHDLARHLFHGRRGELHRAWPLPIGSTASNETAPLVADERLKARKLDAPADLPLVGSPVSPSLAIYAKPTFDAVAAATAALVPDRRR